MQGHQNLEHCHNTPTKLTSPIHFQRASKFGTATKFPLINLSYTYCKGIKIWSNATKLKIWHCNKTPTKLISPIHFPNASKFGALPQNFHQTNLSCIRASKFGAATKFPPNNFTYIFSKGIKIWSTATKLRPN